MDGNDEDRVLAVEQRGTVRYLTLDRPDVLNALNARVFSELEAQISAVAADPGIRAVVIAGAGDRAFSAGADLDEPRGLGPRRRDERASPASDFMTGETIVIDGGETAR